MFAFALIIYRWLLLAFQPFFASPPGTSSLPSDNVLMSSVEPTPSSTSSTNRNNFNETLANRVAELEDRLRQQVGQSVQLGSYPKEPKISSPSPFKGNKADAEEFILKCQSVFDICSRTYHDDKTKLAFVFNLLDGDAYQWVKPALLTRQKPAWVETWEDFKVEFYKNFADSDVKETSRRKLKALKQIGPASTYATDFKKYALYLEWSDEGLRQAFFDGLKFDVQDRLLSPQRFTSFTELVESAIEWDNLLFQRRKVNPNSRTSRFNFATRDLPSPSSSNVHKTVETSVKGPWPMDVDSVQPRKPLTQGEKDYRRKNNLCLYCGNPGHKIDTCRKKPSPQKLSPLEGSSNSEKSNPHQY
jgi:hypothetical protein